MTNSNLTQQHLQKYDEIKPLLKQRLIDFKNVSKEDYFYEFCFCICTPQSKAKNALEVQKILMKDDFLNKPFDVTKILREPSRYIRFHNQKAVRLHNARLVFPEIQNILDSNLSNFEKRNWLADNFNGFGMKESSHFLRNIGYENLAILDRHILRHLTDCGIYPEIPKIKSIKHYKEIEIDFLNFALNVGISMDELDLLFWASSAGEIIK